MEGIITYLIWQKLLVANSNRKSAIEPFLDKMCQHLVKKKNHRKSQLKQLFSPQLQTIRLKADNNVDVIEV